jgi:hypothetical protein
MWCILSLFLFLVCYYLMWFGGFFGWLLFVWCFFVLSWVLCINVWCSVVVCCCLCGVFEGDCKLGLFCLNFSCSTCN